MKKQLCTLALAVRKIANPKALSRSLLAITLTTSIIATAGETPKKATPSKVPIEKLCPIPGIYTEHVLGEFTIIACALVSTKTCVYLPGPCLPAEGSASPGQSVPAPAGIDLPEGQKFIARYNEEGKFIVTLVNEYTVGTLKNDDGTNSITIIYK